MGKKFTSVMDKLLKISESESFGKAVTRFALPHGSSVNPHLTQKIALLYFPYLVVFIILNFAFCDLKYVKSAIIQTYYMKHFKNKKALFYITFITINDSLIVLLTIVVNLILCQSHI